MGANRPPEEFSDSLPTIPEFEIDRFGYRVDTTSTMWRLWDPYRPRTLDWNAIPKGTVKTGFMLYICYAIRALAPRTVSGLFETISPTLRKYGRPVADLEEMDLNWWKHLKNEVSQKLQPGSLNKVRKWYLWMSDQDLAGTCAEIAFELESWRLPGSVKGEAVERRDKDTGPLSDRQFAALIQVLRRAQPATLDQAAVMLCADLGANPRALCMLEERDLRVFRDSKDPASVQYQIDLPRLKKRLECRETRRRKIDGRTGRVLEELMRQNKIRFGDSDEKRPILCRKSPRPGLIGTQLGSRFGWHHTTHEISAIVHSYGAERKLRTPGPGGCAFDIRPRRLRYTFACRLAAQGASGKVIADLLDHSDTQYVVVYINTKGRLSGRLSRAMDAKMRPIVEMFLGRIMALTDEQRLDGPEPQIPGRTWDGRALGGIGVCGSGELCRLTPPLTCYICEHFQPHVDGPHKDMLEMASRLRSLTRVEKSDAEVKLLDDVVAHIRGAIEAVGQLGKREDET